MPRVTYFRIGAFAVALLFITGVILLSSGSPVQVAAGLWTGAFGSTDRFARVISTLCPLLLAACGLIFTFTSGLYNLGIEGQIIAGAIASTFLLRLIPEGFSPAIAIVLAMLCGILGGGLWGLLAGLLNVYGKVSEIFAGLGMNFMAQGLSLYLVFGPWKRSGVASMSGTEPFSDALALPTIGNTDFSPIALAIAIFALILTAIAIKATYYGLKLKAVGNNLRAAYVLGIPAIAQMLSSFAICGALAGLAGSLQVVAVFHRLIPNISSNLGFLALLVVMLVNYNPFLILPIAFLFSSLNVGSLELPISLSLDSSLSGIIQGALLLFAILGEGLAKASTKFSHQVNDG
ncbi:MAG: ABC transporter permease [Pseudanabaena frigida]|uniref:ABC transporter permease n=1 Tax=Pseudanabaena frigida TaxID=945775 RepID=A0A2W4WB15_9CYAN|nr:MAG: ABC transporter permease [Pseudanabaena frigida]